MTRRALITQLPAVALAGALVSKSVFAADNGVTVGIHVSLTGAGAEDAILVKNGAMLAIDDANAKGGVAGYSIDAMVLDDGTATAGQYDPAQAAVNARKMISDSNVRHLATRYPHGLIHSILTCPTPMTDNKSMILQWIYRYDTEEQVSAADVIAFDRAVTLEDKRILESCDADVPLADSDGEEMHMHTNYPGVVMRRMFTKLLADHGETEQRAGA